jgi:xylulokinase
MLGTGLGTPGEAFDVAGTSEILGMTAAAVSDPHPGILVLPLYEELSVVYGLTNAGADALRWCAEAFGLGDGPGGLRALDAEAAKADPGARGLVFLPYVSGERSPVWDDDATGVFFGCLRSHTRPEFARAVVEGLAHSVRQILSLCAAAIGAPPSVVRASGGGTRSRFVNQVKADVLGIPVVAMNSPETAALGAAMLAGIGCGLLTGYDDAVRTMTRESAVFEPHPELGSVYDDAHTVYEALYPALKDVKAAGSRKALLR